VPECRVTHREPVAYPSDFHAATAAATPAATPAKLVTIEQTCFNTLTAVRIVRCFFVFTDGDRHSKMRDTAPI
jgi:hypothetical protein